MSRHISVRLSKDQMNFVRRSFAEVGGGSSGEFLRIANRSKEDLESAGQEFDVAISVSSIKVRMSEASWRTVYEVINATIYALGPFELSTVTGFGLQEAAETNLRICSAVWGAYGGASWLDKEIEDLEQGDAGQPPARSDSK